MEQREKRVEERHPRIYHHFNMQVENEKGVDKDKRKPQDLILLKEGASR